MASVCLCTNEIEIYEGYAYSLLEYWSYKSLSYLCTIHRVMD